MKANIATIMEKVNGGSIISIDTETTPTIQGGKTNPHVGNIRKITKSAQVMVFTNKKGSSYEKAVHRRLKEEGKDPNTFVLSPRSWGTRIDNTPFVVHTDKDGVTKMYLEVIFMKPGKSTYTYNGVAIDKKDIVGLKDKDEAEQGGLSDKVIIRTFNIESIKGLRAFGQSYDDLYFQLD